MLRTENYSYCVNYTVLLVYFEMLDHEKTIMPRSTIPEVDF